MGGEGLRGYMSSNPVEPPHYDFPSYGPGITEIVVYHFTASTSDSSSSETSPDMTPTNDKESRVDPAELAARLKQLQLRTGKELF